MIALLAASLGATAQAADTTTAANEFASLCSIGIEGTFQGFIEKTSVLVNVICLDSGRMAMSIDYGKITKDVPITLINSLIDDDGTLVFSMSPLDPADRKSATSGSPTIYVRLDIESLKSGTLRGVYLGGNSVKPEELTAKRKVSLPAITDIKSMTVSPRAICGTYKFNLPGLPPRLLWFDMVSGVPVVNISDGNRGLHLIDGPAWDGSGAFAVTDVFGDFMPVSFANLIQVRGYITHLGELEVYYVDPIHGVQGPLRAIRQ